MDKIEKLLIKPENDFRGMPFWSWNGKLEKEELLRQIHVMKDMGFGGFFIHSRTGLVTEYLGSEWMDFVKSCSEEGAKLGLNVYLYDEDRWPSGSAGGYATKDPKYRTKYMSLAAADEIDAQCLAAFAISFDDADKLKEYYPVEKKTEVREGFSLHVLKTETMACDSFYNGYTYLDTLNREATDKFIAETHEKYKAAMGEMFGKQIVGIFTDEPHRGCSFGGFGIRNENAREKTPYSAKLFERFSELKGYSLLSRLPELFFAGENHFAKVSYDYIHVLQEMFLENFAIPYQNWCRENKLVVTGHILHEDTLSNQAAISGSVMSYYEYMDYPGVDILTENNRAYWVAKQVSSVAKQTGKPFVLSELYGCTGWQFNFESHKTVGDWQTAMGINMRCHHLSWYSMRGEAKRDYPASIFYQSAWYDKYDYVETYFARMGKALSYGKPVTDVLVIHPVESVWGHVHKNVFEGIWSANAEIDVLENKFSNQFEALISRNVDFDYTDERILSRHGAAGKGGFKVGEMTYKTVLVSGMETIRASTLMLLKKFAALGGKVIMQGTPRLVDGMPSDASVDGSVYADSPDAAALLCAADKLFSTNATGLLLQARKIDGGYLAVVINSDRENGKDGVTVSLGEKLNVYEYDLRLGEKRACKFNRTDDKVTVTTDFAKGQERMFVFTADNVPVFEADTAAVTAVTLPDSLNYMLSEPNILVLDMPEVWAEGESLGRAEVLSQDFSLRSRFGYPIPSGEEVQPWFKEKYQKDKEGKGHPVKAVYGFDVEVVPEDISLVMEDPQNFSVKLNGVKIEGFSDKTFIDNSLHVCPIAAGVVKKGDNVLEIECMFLEKIRLESVYLIGNFGVRLDGGTSPVLTALPEKLSGDSFASQGLPFYSGKITLYTGITEKGEYKMEFDSVRAAYIEADFGKNSEMVCFPPYNTKSYGLDGEMKFTVCLTRRNTFGPLHALPAKASAYGPWSFRTKGDDYSDAYVFYNECIDFPKIFKKK